MVTTPTAVEQRSKAKRQMGILSAAVTGCAHLGSPPACKQRKGSEHALHELNQHYLVAGFYSFFVSVPYFLHCSFSRGKAVVYVRNGKRMRLH